MPRIRHLIVLTPVSVAVAVVVSSAQQPSPPTPPPATTAQQPAAPAQPPGTVAGLASRRTTAVTYDANRDTKIDMVGTPMMPRSRGEVKIKTESSGPVIVEAKVKGLTPAGQFGAEYLTYVLWAIPPQGRPKNLGELRLDDDEAEIKTTVDVQTFSLVATAEPYYAVTAPSEVVVLENVVREDTKGHTSIATLQYDIVPRGAYVAAAGAGYELPPPGKKEPPDVQQARNALKIAQLAQADKYAASGLATAQQLMTKTEGLLPKGSKRDIISAARATVQQAEATRLQSVDGRVEAEQAAARATAAAGEQAAREKAAQEAAARAQAEQARVQAEQERQRAETLATQAAADRQKAEAAKAAAEAQARKAEQDKVALRATLQKQFSQVLETHDTSRGLVVNVGDVLFETGRYELKPEAREKLARFSGIILGHPGLTVQAEGFTDSTGSAETTQKLSEQRADAVAQYLMSQGIPGDRLTTKGYGPSYPVATNGTREGRSQNRRVELVVAGDIIGTPIGATGR
jgi:outer membrane protein OmpA-like peptidoglycan-associated protein